MYVCTFSVVFVTSPLYLPRREYPDVCRWSTLQHRRMLNATPPASKDLFSTVPCNSDWQWTVELLAIWLGAPLSTVIWSCLEQLKTPTLLAGGVAFVPLLYGIHCIKMLMLCREYYCIRRRKETQAEGQSQRVWIFHCIPTLPPNSQTSLSSI